MRPAAATAVLGMALAVGVPTAWELTRPSASAGAPVEQVLQGPPAPRAGRVSATAARDAVPARRRSRPGTRHRRRPPHPGAGAARPFPRLGVDAAVDAVGVEADGQMTIPAEVDRVGWYRFGPAPGRRRLLGDRRARRQPRRRASARWPRCASAAPGDEVVVTDAAGAATRWRVVSRELISKQVLPLDRLFARDGPPRLTLITCGGPSSRSSAATATTSSWSRSRSVTGLLAVRPAVGWVASGSWIRCRRSVSPPNRTTGRSAGGSRRATSRRWRWAYERWAGQVHGMAVRAFGPGPGRRGRHPADLHVGLDRPRAATDPTKGPLPAWLVGVCRHKIADTWAKRARQQRGDGGGDDGGAGDAVRPRRPRASTPPSPTGSCCSTSWTSWASPSAGSSSWPSSRTSRTRRSPRAPACRSARSRVTSGALWSACGPGWRWTVEHCTPEQLALAALREPLPDADTAHLAACERCRAEVASLQRAVDALAVPELAAPGAPVAPPPRVWESIAAATGVSRHAAARAGRGVAPAAVPGTPVACLAAGRRRRPTTAVRVVPFRARRRPCCWSRPPRWPAWRSVPAPSRCCATARRRRTRPGRGARRGRRPGPAGRQRRVRSRLGGRAGGRHPRARGRAARRRPRRTATTRSG